METAHAPPADGTARELGAASEGSDTGSRGLETAAAPVVQQTAAHEKEAGNPPGFGPAVTQLPVELDVAVPVREFRVRHLLTLMPGQLIESQWNHGNDVPLAAGDVQAAWCEFEVMETQLAVRVTRLA